jgi:parvulin-like peptidyl-prolyl isomerase
MDPKFEATAFALKAPSDVSEVIKTRFGFHIIQLVDPATRQTRPYSQVQFSIRRKLEKEAVDSYLMELREKAQISYPEKG